MKEKIFTITLEGCTNVESEDKKFQRLLKNEYHVDGRYTPCKDCTVWHLSGTAEDLRRVIDDQWNPGGGDEINYGDAAAIMYKDEFEKLYGVKYEDYI